MPILAAITRKRTVVGVLAAAVVVANFAVQAPAAQAGTQWLPVTDAAAVRDATGVYSLTWHTASYVHQVTVYAATHPSARPRGQVVAHTDTGAATVAGLDPLRRWYFTIAPDRFPLGEQVGVKVVTLDGVRNARDLGGYPAAYGLRVRWGVVFRAGRLTPATELGRTELIDLNLSEDIDFRSTAESQLEGLDPVGANTTYFAEPIGDPDQAVPPDPNTPPSDGNPITDSYRLLVSNPNLSHQYRDALAHIAARPDGDAPDPVLYHCTGGNHRTGWMTVILLSILGVPDDVIRADYLMSTGTLDAYLDAAYDQANRDYGSFAGYLRDGVGVTPELTFRLRRMLLEPVL